MPFAIPTSSTKDIFEALTNLSERIPEGQPEASVLIEAAQRLREQQELLLKCAPHIEARAEAAHILDGFRPMPHPWDALAREVRAAALD